MCEAHVVSISLVEKTSLTEIGIPESFLSFNLSKLLSKSFAFFKASSLFTVIYALRVFSSLAILSR